ncbi:binding-protein-dependent transport systems inner membrane component [Beutenbergia cavernae DSM 12333]|uniref:Binding-protein-dependent transport systems inner membrane component n=1 Tax=Beutenbergia cavernae (strain ATCC BAA-8 / DSM 12333 / CCUG 43141 / JCM 11478 / NBRC 16432 / NCIMB 13614 / HKI 0122) TaxID=471853 RepID=C5BXI9_BEUC1|nr:ABC transporter permease subunit [Beutenbergia cavernae]ACQ80872.1 binding-protein-dependent transport systems inner membrane component [Beutenbergia cavernae DSM 12333]
MAVAVTAGTPRPGSASAGARSRNRLVAALFLAPATIALVALVLYPIGYSVWRSLFSARGDEFVGFGNFVDMFTDPATFQAIRNNIIWVLVAPLACTMLGLVFAVLMERIGWRTAFKLIVFMPMAISMLAAGVIFRTVFDENPQTGVVNAVVVAVRDTFSPSADYAGARPRPETGLVQEGTAVATDGPVATGTVVDFPLVGIPPDTVPADAAEAVAAEPGGDDVVTGTVWLDFIAGGGGTNGEVGDGKPGLTGVTVQARAPDGTVTANATTEADGRFELSGLDPGTEYEIVLPESNFTEGAGGISWLGPSLITPVVILSYVWIWAGFAMVMIASGLSATDRSLQEAARVDGANEWQVFTRITIPQLYPVLIVVIVTLIINVLKIFDLVYVIPPGESKPAANVIAVQMWNVSFGGGNNQGLGSALAIFLLVLVLPAMIMNIRNFRKGGRP